MCQPWIHTKILKVRQSQFQRLNVCREAISEVVHEFGVYPVGSTRNSRHLPDDTQAKRTLFVGLLSTDDASLVGYISQTRHTIVGLIIFLHFIGFHFKFPLVSGINLRNLC